MTGGPIKELRIKVPPDVAIMIQFLARKTGLSAADIALDLIRDALGTPGMTKLESTMRTKANSHLEPDVKPAHEKFTT